MYSNLFLLFAVTNVISSASIHLKEQEAEEDPPPPVLFRLPQEAPEGDGSGRRSRDSHKREAGDNVVDFALRINPVIPRNPMSLKNFTELNCVGRKSWCVEEPTPPPPLCPPVDTPPSRPTTCGPTKPFSPIPRRFRTTMCVFQRSDFPTPGDPCDECYYPPTTGSTPFKACQSVPPPTKPEKLIYCSPTMVSLHPPCTYMTPPEHTTKYQQPCKAQAPDTKGQKLLAGDGQYYILVKRSPKGRNRKRKKREYKPEYLVPRRKLRLGPQDFQLMTVHLGK